MQYESPIPSDLKVMAMVKGFVHATDPDADSRADISFPDIFVPAR